MTPRCFLRRAEPEPCQAVRATICRILEAISCSYDFFTMKKAVSFLSGVAIIGSWFVCGLATAHVSPVNNQLHYAVAGKSYELVLAVPHGCAYTKEGGVAAEADTYKVEVSVPAGFAGVRPIIDGVFGRPTLTKDASNAVTKLIWTKAASFDSSDDDQSYRIGLRGTAPNAPFTTIVFNTKQFCKNPLGGDDLVNDWSAYGTPPSNQSPKVKVFPARSPGWNKYSLAATNEKHTQADVKALLTDFFADAQIVWLPAGTNTGAGAWSSNTETALRIKTLASKDPGTYEIAANATVMIHSTDILWAKY
jgi:periplasmic copper chaperone A